MTNGSFEVLARDGRARLGRLRTARHEIATPVFMPVGTQATVKGVQPRDLVQLGARIVLGNAYHLYLRPGHERIARFGGLASFMGWEGATLTDSGGYQVLSLRDRRQISEDGVCFRSHLDGSAHHLTPERVMEIQNALGSDIAMPLDICPPARAPEAEIRHAVEVSARWAERSLAAHRRKDQMLFGIVQGGTDEALRRVSISRTTALGFDGFAIGGLAVGEEKPQTYATIALSAASLPAEQPRYLMGMGTPLDLVEAVTRGVDMFDSVLPTRNARNASVFTSEGRLNLRNARFADDPGPLDPACACPACRGFSRAYLRHLVQAGELLAPVLLTLHNLFHYLDTMEQIRQAIAVQRLDELRRKIAARERSSFFVAGAEEGGDPTA